MKPSRRLERSTAFITYLIPSVLLILGSSVACDDHGEEGHDHGEEGHDHGEGGHDHGEEGHDNGAESDRHDHSTAHPEGHDHHADGHGHDGEPVVRVTLWSDTFELFGEHPPGVAGRELRMLAHITVLDGFVPPEGARVRLELDGPAQVRGEAEEAVRPGIFEITATPPAAGTYRGRLVVEGDPAGAIEGLSVEVFPSEDAAQASVEHDESDEGLVEFLKEQQWGVPFATAFVTAGSVVPSIEVSGRVQTPPGGSAEVGAPITGRLVAPRGGFPHPGTAVRRGQVLASLVPTPSSPEEAARASLTVAEAEARASAATLALSRAERLIADEAISARELEDARREADVSQAAVRAAQNASRMLRGTGDGAGSWRLTAPIDGTLDAVRATPGATVSPGDVLFRIVDARELWIAARVPEQDAARLRADRDAAYRVAGTDAWRVIDVTPEPPDDDGDREDDSTTGSVVSVGRTVDPVSRTVDVLYALRAEDPALRVGGLVDVSIPAGEARSGITVPRSAVLDDEGRSIVYVQVDGEHFEDRLVRVSLRSGDRIALTGNLREGERIVTRGAHLIRLADRAEAGGAHGHIH